MSDEMAERDLRRVPIRFSPRTHALIKHEAELEGVTLTQFIREAALARAFLAMGRRGEIAEQDQGLRMAREALMEEDGRRKRTGED